jgi:acyl carrier protein
MNKEQLLKELKYIFEKKEINENINLEKLNFDSLKILELISLKETKFKNLKIKPIDFHNCKRVIDIVKLFKVK